MNKFLFFCFTIVLISCQKENQDDNSTNGSNQTNDLCVGISCQNGGYCQNGSCVCPPGYDGTNCQNQLPSVTMEITSIKVDDFPSSDNGSNWDILDGPDLLVTANPGTSSNQNGNVSTAQNNVNVDNSYTFQNLNWVFSANTNVTIGIWDADSPDADDFMGGFYFLPQQQDDDFPSSLHYSNGTIDVTVFVEWTF